MRKFSTFSILVLCASVFLIACNKADDFSTQQARILVANATLTAPLVPSAANPTPSPLPTAGPAFDVRWDGQFIIPNIIYGAASITTGSSLTSVSSAQFVTANYAQVKNGTFGLNFSAAGQGGGGGVTIYDRPVTLAPARSYTAVAFDFSLLFRTLLMEDDLSAPAAGKVKVRFIHAIPQTILNSVPRKDTIDITATGGTTAAPLNNVAVFPLRNFADAATNTRFHQFAVLDSGRYNIGVRVAGTPGTAPATGLLGLFPNLRLVEGKIYTIIARVNVPGLATNPPSPAAITIVTHN
ncbi:DUF4397 domain-containing protein [Lacibacter sp. MH-610]|uniref:DUF4397 domain-containing protein n=1 Tax=Lacibacter sp. MH-610 TaxID=3020883 RepID=UPI003891B375